MDHVKLKQKRNWRRKMSVRRKLFGTPDRPRLSVFRSNKHIYAQIIDDVAQRTLCAIGTRSKELTENLAKTGNAEAAKAIGRALGQKAVAAGIKKVVFDRGPYKYHGRVKALADAAREAGLEF